ncbi:hypothetical protein I5Q82_09105 [Acutalibacter muris]|uniref:DUF4179 domain-containing protein n=1 Tax=Acutalibacter muris TaxID=1796620 RepID=A0A1Z2XVL6_9FIRM|nr:hypothetical protein [Acutalibacter muris]ANU54283.1 hypothetical protein A4V00_09770 [Hungateiclostridiaceae bacterium KB18]ASB42498.1 hypothetical protein ADH66_18690 [Acutalibacter muris]QQR31789.1 hypothetical protein I5Q82_09105 [Acutalibacter muris]
MAEMKHMKKPEPKLPRRRPPEREPKEPKPRVPMGRDRAFRAALAEEYGVAEVPRRLQRRTQKTLDSLPDTLPVLRRPVLRAVRSMATAAAVLAVTFAALLGLNTTHPQLTEALPGLGSVFAAMNGSPTPCPLPTAEPTPQPEFQPVTVLSRGDFDGLLVVEDAWSDGKSLLLDLSLSPGEDFYAICKNMGRVGDVPLWPATVGLNEYGEEYLDNTCSVKIHSGEDSHGVEGDALSAFMPDGEDGLRARWLLDLEDLQAGEELKVDISIPDLTANMGEYDTSGIYSWSPGFEATITLPVTKDKNRAFSLQASDGPVTLKSVDYSPSRVVVDVSLPYLGLAEDILPGNGEFDGLPLGFYARLTCQGPDGEKFIYSNASLENKSDTDPELSGQADMRYTFTVADDKADPRELKSLLVLTLYEFPPEYGVVPGYGSRVTAEFTIDLNTGRAYASENYLEEGCEKGDASKTTSERLLESGYDDLLLLPSENSLDNINVGADPLAHFVISAPSEKSGRELTVNCYLEDTVYRSFTFVLGGDYKDGYDSSYTGYRYFAGREYLDTAVTIAYPAYVAETMGYVPFDRLELVDTITQKVIIPDLSIALIETEEKLLGKKYKEVSDNASVSGSESVL